MDQIPFSYYMWTSFFPFKGPSKSLTPPPGMPSKKDNYKRKVGKKREKLPDSDIIKWFNKAGVETVLNEKGLNGTQRILFSNLATKEECEKLVNLALVWIKFNTEFEFEEFKISVFIINNNSLI